MNDAKRKCIWKYLAIAVLPTLLLLNIPIRNVVVLSLGTAVLLETRPVDPRDLLRGDYVRLDYEISDIPKKFVTEELRELADAERALYVHLALDEKGVASVAGVSAQPPRGGIYLEARPQRRWGSSSLTCDYGLGVYYVPEGTGLELERAMREHAVFADVRVLRGRGVIRKLEIVRK